MLHPDDRDLRRASFLDDGADIRDDGVVFVGAAHDAVLHVDHEECSVRAVVECRHGASGVAQLGQPDVNGSNTVGARAGHA